MYWETPAHTASLNTRQCHTEINNIHTFGQCRLVQLICMSLDYVAETPRGNLSGSENYCPSSKTHLQWKWRKLKDHRSGGTGWEADLLQLSRSAVLGNLDNLKGTVLNSHHNGYPW